MMLVTGLKLKTPAPLYRSITTGLACLVIGPLLCGGGVAAQDTLISSASTGDNLRVQVVDDFVTLSARRVAIKDLLKAIARESGLTLVLYGNLDEPVTMKFRRLPFSKAVGRIVRHHNFALHYVQPSASAGKAASSSKLWVFAAGPGYYSNLAKDMNHASSLTALTLGAPPPEGLRSDQPLRREVAGDLAALDASEVVARLSYALVEEDPKLRLRAVSALAEIGSEEAAGVLLAALGDSDPLVREEAALAMGEIGGVTASQALRQSLSDHDSHVRAAAIGALVEIDGEASVQVLSTALRDRNLAVREQAVDALAEIGGDAAIELLKQTFRADEVKVRAAAIEALADIGGDNAARALAIALHDKEPTLRSEAVNALEDIDSEVAARVLEQALESD